MSNLPLHSFRRAQSDVLASRLAEPRRRIQVVAGARQVGKTTLVQQVLEASAKPFVFASADEPSLRDSAWLAAQWERGRVAAAEAGRTGAVLALDEVQKILADVKATTAQLPAAASTVGREVQDLPGVVVQSQATLREAERLILGLQQNWLIRKHVPATPATELIPASTTTGH